MKNKRKITTFDELFTKESGEKGSVEKDKNESDSLAFRLGVMLKEARKEVNFLERIKEELDNDFLVLFTLGKNFYKRPVYDLSVFKLNLKFPLNNFNLDPTFEDELDKIVDAMLENPELKITVIGHSCDLGTAQVKKNIAIKRAEVVKIYLVKNGVDATRVNTKGVNDTQPIVSNTSEEYRAKNRRVEFVVELGSEFNEQ